MNARTRIQLHGLLAAVLRVGAAGVLVRALQAGKEMLVADRFGTSPSLEAYLVAASVPLFLTQSLGAALGDAVLPAYLRIRARSPGAAAALPRELLRRTIVPALLGAIAVALLAPLLVPLIGSGLNDGARATAVSSLRAIAVVPLFFIGAALYSAMVSAEGNPALANLSQSVTPLCTAACIFLSPTTRGLALGLTIGSAAEACGSLVLFRKTRSAAPGAEKPTRDELIDIRAQFLPLLASTIVGALGALINQAMASSLGSGELSTLAYANRIVLPLAGLAAAVLSGALYPRLSAEAALRDWPAVRRSTRSALWLAGAASLAAVLALILGAHPLVKLLFERGAFSASDTARVAPLLAILSLQLVPLLVGLVGVRLLITLGDGRAILVIGIVNVVNTIVGNLLLMPRYGIEAIAAVTVGVYALSSSLVMLRALSLLRQRERESPPDSLRAGTL